MTRRFAALGVLGFLMVTVSSEMVAGCTGGTGEFPVFPDGGSEPGRDAAVRDGGRSSSGSSGTTSSGGTSSGGTSSGGTSGGPVDSGTTDAGAVGEDPTTCYPLAPRASGDITWSGLPACSGQGYCTMNPTPTALTASTATPLPDGTMFAFAGETLLEWNPTSRTGAVHPSVLPQPIEDILPISKTEVLAVGADSMVARWNAGTWTSSRLTNGSWLGAMWAASATDVFAVGNFGVVGRYNGASWSSRKLTGDPSLHAIGGTTASDVYTVGSNGDLRHFDGVEWTKLTSGTTQDLYGVHAVSTSEVWVVGRGGTVLRGNASAGFTPVVVAGVGPTELRAVWASGPNDVWIASGGAFYHYDGNAWSLVPGNGAWRLRGLGPNDVWASGGNGLAPFQHWDGQAWSDVFRRETGSLDAVWTSGSGTTWAVGEEGRIVRVDGETVTVASSGDADRWTGVWGSGVDDVWIGGARGRVLHWNGTRLCRWNLGTALASATGSIAVAGTARDNVWLTSGTAIARYDGQRWTTAPMPPNASFRALRVLGPSDVWAVGSGIWHWTGSWQQTSVPGADATDRYDSVWAATSDDVYAIRSTRVIRVASGTASELAFPSVYGGAVGGSSASDVWVTGTSLFQGVGTVWTSQSTGSLPRGHAIGVTPGEVWIAGDQGMLVRKRR